MKELSDIQIMCDLKGLKMQDLNIIIILDQIARVEKMQAKNKRLENDTSLKNIAVYM